MGREARLTPRQEAYARALFGGRTQAAAYREAYPRSAAWKKASVKTAARKLARVVGPFVAELRAEAARAAVCSARELAEGLSGLFRAAVETGRAPDAERLAARIAALLGYDAPRRIDATVRPEPPLSDDELRRIALDEE